MTEVVSDTSNPDFNHKKVFSFRPVTQQLLDYLKEGSVNIQVWGKQISRAPTRSSGYINKPNLQEELLNQTNNLMDGFKMNGRIIEPNRHSLVVELLLLKKQQTRLQQRLVRLTI